jgi:hypothetical protein
MRKKKLDEEGKKMIGKCEVCGQETEIIVANSACGAISSAYCYKCLENGYEPYDNLVGMGMTSDEISENFKQEILLPSLKFLDKTLEQFDKDVQELNDKYMQWIKEHAAAR